MWLLLVQCLPLLCWGHTQHCFMFIHFWSFLCFKLDALTFNCNQVCFEIILCLAAEVFKEPYSKLGPTTLSIKIIQVDQKKPLRLPWFFHTKKNDVVFFLGAFGALKDYPNKILQHLNFTAFPTGEHLEDGVNFHCQYQVPKATFKGVPKATFTGRFIQVFVAPAARTFV